MRSIRDMTASLFSQRHDRNKYPFPRHQDRLRSTIRGLIYEAHQQDAR